MYSTLESIRPLINYFNSFERYVTKTTVSDTYEVVAGDTLTVVVSAGSSATITFEEAVVAPEYNIAISGYGLSLDAELIISAKFAIPVELQNDAGASIKVQFINDVTEYNLVEYINENGERCGVEFVCENSVIRVKLSLLAATPAILILS